MLTGAFLTALSLHHRQANSISNDLRSTSMNESGVRLRRTSGGLAGTGIPSAPSVTLSASARAGERHTFDLKVGAQVAEADAQVLRRVAGGGTDPADLTAVKALVVGIHVGSLLLPAVGMALGMGCPYAVFERAVFGVRAGSGGVEGLRAGDRIVLKGQDSFFPAKDGPLHPPTVPCTMSPAAAPVPPWRPYLHGYRWNGHFGGGFARRRGTLPECTASAQPQSVKTKCESLAISWGVIEPRLSAGSDGALAVDSRSNPLNTEWRARTSFGHRAGGNGGARRPRVG